MVVSVFPSKPATSFYPSERTLNNYTAIHDLEGGGKGCMWDEGTLIINNNNKALCFVRMRRDATSETKCSEDGKPSADDLACFAQPTGTILAGRHKGCNYRGEQPPHKSYQMKSVGPTMWRL